MISSGKTQLIFDPVPGRRMERNADVFISHAHADHTFGFASNAKKYATKETREIYEALRKRPVKNWSEVKLHSTIKLREAEVVPKDAGHMLGSVQFKVITPEVTVLYTGDLNCVDTLTTKAAEEEPCDCLILEATYGHPAYVFPRRDTTYAEIVQWAMSEIKRDRLPTFQVYSSGKAQEIVRLFNVYTRVPVVCHPLVASVNDTYSKNGMKLDSINALSPEGQSLLEKEPAVYVTSPSDKQIPERASLAAATGWSVRFRSREYASFPLSSHADYEQLVAFVKNTRAKTVYAFTGYTQIFTEYLSRRFKIDAKPLPLLAQTRLVDFQVNARR